MENLMQEMLRVLAGRGVERERALRALRALSSWFGGQLVYIPQQKRTQSRIGQEIYGVLADAVGDADAQRIYDIIARLYGGTQWYIPVEKRHLENRLLKRLRKSITVRLTQCATFAGNTECRLIKCTGSITKGKMHCVKMSLILTARMKKNKGKF